MKQRIVETLIDLAREPNQVKMLESLIKQTGLTREQIGRRAEKTIERLLNEYTSFAVETIDSFNYRIIRTFARELKIGQQTEISLETDRYLEEAVDRVIHQAGMDVPTTKLLLEYSFYKMEEGNSWDVSFDLLQVAPDVIKEFVQPHLKQLESKTLADFQNLKAHLLDRNKELDQKVLSIAQDILETIGSAGAERSDLARFFGAALDKFINQTADLNTSALDKSFYKGTHQGGTKLYKANTKGHVKAKLDGLLESLTDSYTRIRNAQVEQDRNRNVIKQLVPTAALHQIRTALEAIKKDRDLIFISDFNLLIQGQVKNQPAPFIYERLGQRYQHYYIDEFQDTSELQWTNMVPLVENSLIQMDNDGQTGSLLVVGDAKQAIYRWRGGEAEQFIDLYQKRLPFSLPESAAQTIPLGFNWRSAPEIVNFNNDFFQHIAELLPQNDYRELYRKGNQQIAQQQQAGHVCLHFVEGAKKEDRLPAYIQMVLDTLGDLRARSFPFSAVCILTRTAEQGSQIGKELLTHGIPVVSEETLLLKNASVVQGIIAALRLLKQPEENEHRLAVLLFLHQHFKPDLHTHSFLLKGLERPTSKWHELLPQNGQEFRLDRWGDLPLLDAVEYLLRSLHISTTADPTIPAFMDLLMDYIKQGNPSLCGFLEYWELKKDKASATSLGGGQGVRIMTIHKAKGLEFPVVIVPFLEENTRPRNDLAVWYPWGEVGFNEVRLRFKKELQEYGSAGQSIYKRTKAQAQLDITNLLYVAMTRPELELHLMTGASKNKSEVDSYYGYFISFLKKKGLWEEGKTRYSEGNAGIYSGKIESNNDQKAVPYTVTSPQQRATRFVMRSAYTSEELEEAKEFGTLLHEVMSGIRSQDDLSLALERLNEYRMFSSEVLKAVSERVHAIVHHPELQGYFNTIDRVYNEQELMSSDAFLIPDRFQINPEGIITLIDYKTGKPLEKHEHQIAAYKQALEDMGYTVKNMLLVYCSQPAIVINKV